MEGGTGEVWGVGELGFGVWGAECGVVGGLVGWWEDGRVGIGDG